VRSAAIQAITHQRPERHRLEQDRLFAGLDARQVQHVVDQCQQVGAGLQDVANMGAVRLGQRPRRVGVEQLGEAEDRVHRRAQLMAHRREEFRLGPTRALGLVARHAQRLLGGMACAEVAGDRDVVPHRAVGPHHHMGLDREPQRAAVLQLVAQLGRGLAFAAQLCVHALQRVDIGLIAAQQLGDPAARGLLQRVAGQAREGRIDPFDAVVRVGDGYGVVSMRGHQRELALFGLACQQALTCVEEGGHVGEGTHEPGAGQEARLHLQHRAARRAAQVGLRQGLPIAAEPSPQRAARLRLGKHEVLAIVAMLELVARNLVHRRPAREKGLRNVEKVRQPPVEELCLAGLVQAEHALVHAVQRHGQRLALAPQFVRDPLQLLLVVEQRLRTQLLGLARDHHLAHLLLSAPPAQAEQGYEQQRHQAHRRVRAAAGGDHAQAQWCQRQHDESECGRQVEGGHRQ
jgi:hypothetical protein